MKGSRVGEFEELVLLTVASLFDEAYGVSIQDELRIKASRFVALSTIHVALVRLEAKGFLSSRFDGATKQRGGRRKHLFRVTKSGYKVILQSREVRNQFWKSIPEVAMT